jgi:hypothetical protein
MSVSVYFVSEDQITQPSPVTVDQLVTENMYPCFVDNGHYDALFPVQYTLGIFEGVCSL